MLTFDTCCSRRPMQADTVSPIRRGRPGRRSIVLTCRAGALRCSASISLHCWRQTSQPRRKSVRAVTVPRSRQPGTPPTNGAAEETHRSRCTLVRRSWWERESAAAPPPSERSVATRRPIAWASGSRRRPSAAPAADPPGPAPHPAPRSNPQSNLLSLPGRGLRVAPRFDGCGWRAEQVNGGGLVAALADAGEEAHDLQVGRKLSAHEEAVDRGHDW